MNGNVVANYTADGKPYPISLDVAKPPYILNLTTSSAPVDDSGHPFPGNLGEAEDLLAVQCWNTTVRPMCTYNCCHQALVNDIGSSGLVM